ncbi:MAG: hypothetical protein JXR83_05805 [Deltaproteobacteria bacterium]|nr:hypothetical protein [Deltaproteobacteria bacterium]
MVRAVGSQKVQQLTRDRDTSTSRPPDAFQAQPFLLSQSGAVQPVGDWPRYQPLLPPGLAGWFDKMEVVALDQGNVHAGNEFKLDDKGVVQARADLRPLGHNPYQITLIGKDGSRYSARVDISPRQTGISHQGYDTISGLRFERERPAPPKEIELAPFLLSQSGTALPAGEWPRYQPLLPPGLEGQFEKMEVMALDPGQVHASNVFALDDKGVLQARAGTRPLGHNPYQITLVGRDGSRYSAQVDISPRKTGVSHAGYDTITGLKLALEQETPQPGDQGMAGLARDFAQSHGTSQKRPSLARSPAGIFFQSRLKSE